MNIGFVGLGNMGSGMAQNLQRRCQENGDVLCVFDLNRQAVELLTAQGAIAAQSIADIACSSDVILTSLPSAKQIADVAFGKQGLLANARENAWWFETSTNDLAEWEKVKAQAPASMTLIDAPVTGGAKGAAAGTLTILLGTDKELPESMLSLLTAFTGKVATMGKSGAGYTTKLAQLHLNYLVVQGIGEALMLGAKAGLDLNQLHSVLQKSCAQSYVVDSYIPKVLDGSYDESFALGLAKKDMGLIKSLGEHQQVELSLANAVYGTYCVATEKYGHDAPHLSVLRLIEEQSELLLRS